MNVNLFGTHSILINIYAIYKLRYKSMCNSANIYDHYYWSPLEQIIILKLFGKVFIIALGVTGFDSFKQREFVQYVFTENEIQNWGFSYNLYQIGSVTNSGMIIVLTSKVCKTENCT